ncbi:hypothetical protein QAD02_021431 [Eretmocerus hayati]|uniref:Uncharacterized protein n=1 Tax=Eretmocerus hayati TaxID=131215 RepID=A0ACC2PR98_9HYME|nr:hypothetical protein QAD02_021431 [Eretmocerus hayati]
MFDILNSKNRFCKTPGREAINKDDLASLKEKVEHFVNYIENLQFDGKTVIEYQKVEPSSDFLSKKKCKATKTPSKYKIEREENLSSVYNISYHDYDKASSWVKTAYSKQVIAHIARAVVYSVEKDVHCDRCMALLTGKIEPNSQLTVLKNRGGLRFATDDVICIWNTAERVISRHQHCLRENDNIYQTLITDTLKLLPLSIFLDDEHFFEQEFLSDHRYKLLHLVIRNYFDERLDYEKYILNDSKDRVRMLYYKLTIAKGQ